MRRRIFALGLVATLVSTSALAQGQASAPANGGNSQAGEFILKLAERAVTGLTKPGVTAEERDQRFRDLFHEGFDVPAIARFALGRYWRMANEEERREYLKLFEELIVQTYAHRFTSYSGERLRVVTTRAASDGEHVVTTEVIRNAGAPIKVDWRVFKKDSSFKIYDIVVEGVSMSITQRDDFSALIQRQGGKVAGLNAALRDKIAQTKTN